jgi:hypothetical protein
VTRVHDAMTTGKQLSWVPWFVRYYIAEISEVLQADYFPLSSLVVRSRDSSMNSLASLRSSPICSAVRQTLVSKCVPSTCSRRQYQTASPLACGLYPCARSCFTWASVRVLSTRTVLLELVLAASGLVVELVVVFASLAGAVVVVGVAVVSWEEDESGLANACETRQTKAAGSRLMATFTMATPLQI